MFRFVLFCFLVTIITSSSHHGYYWREYSGFNGLPKDAVIAGADSNNQSFYIGLGYIRNDGEFPGEIHPNVAVMEVEIHGVKVVDRYLKILCGAQDNFAWLSTDEDHLHSDLTGLTPVLGGHADDVGGGTLTYLSHYIGRIRTGASGERVGKILQYEHAVYPNRMCYVGDHETKFASEYQVLIVRH